MQVIHAFHAAATGSKPAHLRVNLIHIGIIQGLETKLPHQRCRDIFLRLGDQKIRITAGPQSGPGVMGMGQRGAFQQQGTDTLFLKGCKQALQVRVPGHFRGRLLQGPLAQPRHDRGGPGRRLPGPVQFVPQQRPHALGVQIIQKTLA